MLWRQLFYTTTHQQHPQQHNSRRGEASCLARPSEGGWLPPPSIPTQIQHNTPSNILRSSHGCLFLICVTILVKIVSQHLVQIVPLIITNGNLSQMKWLFIIHNISLARYEWVMTPCTCTQSSPGIQTPVRHRTEWQSSQHHRVLAPVIYGFH